MGRNKSLPAGLLPVALCDHGEAFPRVSPKQGGVNGWVAAV